MPQIPTQDLIMAKLRETVRNRKRIATQIQTARDRMVLEGEDYGGYEDITLPDETFNESPSMGEGVKPPEPQPQT